jgi:hypothetical protein
VHDTPVGKLDWLAHALPFEGSHASNPTAGTVARQDAAILALKSSAGDRRRAIAGLPYGLALVLSPGRVLLTRARRPAAGAAGPTTAMRSHERR